MIWAFLLLGIILDFAYRTGIREAFEYKQHKSTLKRMHKERKTVAKILGIYSSKCTHAPCHMRRYMVARALNLTVCALCIAVVSFKKNQPYAEAIFAVYALTFLIPSLIEAVALSGMDRRPHFERSKKP